MRSEEELAAKLRNEEQESTKEGLLSRGAQAARRDLAAAREAMLNGTGVEAEMQRMMDEQLERERQKRVEHIAQIGLRRMFQGALAKGWSAWFDMWEEKTRQRRMLAASAGRLSKPKLAAAMNSWRHSWEAEEAAKREALQTTTLAAEAQRRERAETELAKLRKELQDARKAMLEGRGQEAELQRQMEEELEKERAKRVEQLAKVGVRRIMQGALAKGWTAWHDMWAAKMRQKRLLAQSAARLSKPKLAAAVTHWRKDTSTRR